MDEKYGGLGADVLMQRLAIEEMSRIFPALAMSFMKLGPGPARFGA